MKIALIGYGKMGHIIEKIALERGHEIVCAIDIDNQHMWDSPELLTADAVIEFTTPSTAFGNVCRALDKGLKVVCGSTGWTARMPEIKALVEEKDGAFFWSSNFSLGVNIFFAVNKQLARLMNGFAQYEPAIEEIHHIHKLDHPSGTAITIAEGIIDNVDYLNGWTEDTDHPANLLEIDHKREGEVPGTHIVTWDSPVDTITIEHRAKSREGFALGAVVAAEWICGRKGMLSMDMLMDDLIKSGK